MSVSLLLAASSQGENQNSRLIGGAECLVLELQPRYRCPGGESRSCRPWCSPKAVQCPDWARTIGSHRLSSSHPSYCSPTSDKTPPATAPIPAPPQGRSATVCCFAPPVRTSPWQFVNGFLVPDLANADPNCDPCCGPLKVIVQSRKKALSQYCEKRPFASFYLSVSMVQLGTDWTDFLKICYSNIFPKSVEKIQDSLKSDKNNGYIT